MKTITLNNHLIVVKKIDYVSPIIDDTELANTFYFFVRVNGEKIYCKESFFDNTNYSEKVNSFQLCYKYHRKVINAINPMNRIYNFFSDVKEIVIEYLRTNKID